MNPENLSGVLDAYSVFLWQQFQYDWGWLSNPWLFGLGNLLYLVFFTVKWYVLLTPVTIPITVYRWEGIRNFKAELKDKNLFKNN
jgi:hypothetical protein